jgi:hypothetical protein
LQGFAGVARFFGGHRLHEVLQRRRRPKMT